MPLLWFKRKKRQQDEQAPPQAAAQETPTRAEAPAPAPADGADSVRPKRRRGTRGGRNRRKPGDGPERAPAVAATATPAPRAEKAPAAERKREVRSQRSQRRRVPTKRPALPPAKRELFISVDIGEQQVAVLEDDRVAEVYLERPERRSIAGNIYKGSVDNVLPGMEAAFVEIGLEKNGFLYVDEIVVPELEGRRHGRKIQDLLSRGQEILVQAVKDPMKGKGARLTTEISLPGRFVVYVPHGEGIGVSRRLEDDERTRLRDILKNLELPSGGIIVRTAAEGASADDVERDLVFLERLWKTIQARAKELKPPALIYQESELPLRVIRDLFTGDFERAVIDHDLTYRRIVGYLKKTSPHMVERVSRYREKDRMFEAFGVADEIRSTLSRRVDLPSGGYLVFDYAEAFTVIDVNTGRYTGSRSKGSAGNLEDTITKNNLEAVKEVVRQLRLRDIGGIIVIDFIDMANPKNRAQVEEALKTELARDRTKTYVVEISPLGLVEMTRQNVTDGPREILTKKCPTCEGDGIIVSEATAAVAVERRLRALTARSRAQAYRVEVNAHVASLLIGPGASRLAELEAQTKRRFFLEAKGDVHPDHFLVLAQGKLADLAPSAPVAEGAQVDLQLVELARYDPASAVGRVDGYEITVGGAAKRVGKKVKARVERVLDGTAYATLVHPAPDPTPPAPVTAEAEAEKPTRRPRAKKAADGVALEPAAGDAGEEGEASADAEVTPLAESSADAELDDTPAEAGEEKPKRRTRRGSRGGRGRKPRATAAATAGAGDSVDGKGSDEAAPVESVEPVESAAPRIHVPAQTLGRADGAAATPSGAAPTEAQVERVAAEPEVNGDAPPAKRKTRRGTRGGRNRRKKTAAPAAETPAEPGPEAEVTA